MGEIIELAPRRQAKRYRDLAQGARRNAAISNTDLRYVFADLAIYWEELAHQRLTQPARREAVYIGIAGRWEELALEADRIASAQ